MRHAGPVRRELGVPTVMNLLGPLTNPVGVRRAVIGVARPELVETFAHVLARLGAERALVVHGQGLDELTPAGVCHVATGCATARWTSIGDLDPAASASRAARSTDLARRRPPPRTRAIVRAIFAGERGAAARRGAAHGRRARSSVGGRADDLDDGLAARRRGDRLRRRRDARRAARRAHHASSQEALT